MQTEEAVNWTARVVSWGQLIIAMGGVGLALGGIVISNEQRVTRLEVRLEQAIDDNRMQDERYYRTVSARNQEYSQLRADLSSRLDKIEAELVATKVAVSALRRPQ